MQLISKVVKGVCMHIEGRREDGGGRKGRDRDFCRVLFLSLDVQL